MRNNHDDPLSVMWWDPTCDDFQSSDGSLVDGLGFLVRSKFYEFEVKMRCLEDRIEEYKKTTMKPNTLLLLLERVMHDSCVRLGSLKTTFTEMRFGVADFQRKFMPCWTISSCINHEWMGKNLQQPSLRTALALSQMFPK